MKRSYFCTGDVFAEEQNEVIVASAELLYGLIHARYILTTKGLAAMVSYHFVFPIPHGSHKLVDMVSALSISITIERLIIPH